MNRVITRERLEALAPSVFSEAPAEEVSDKYYFVPTIRVVDTLAGKGWFPVSASQTKARSLDGMPYKKHLLRFENEAIPAVEGLTPQIILFNSHDRTSMFSLISGLFRQVCLNGLMVWDELFQSYRIKHLGYRDEDVLFAENGIVEQIPTLLNRVEAFKGITLSRDEQELFACQAAAMRWQDYLKAGKRPPIRLDSPQIGFARRRSDEENSLWATYHIIQENLIKGGLSSSSNLSGRRVRTQTRAIRDVGELVRINKNLWYMAEQIRQAKTKEAH